MKQLTFQWQRSRRAIKPAFLTILLSISLTAQAQVTIGSGEPPHKDALLDLKEDNMGESTKGLLLPRVKLESTDSSGPLSEHVAGMTVYNTAVSLENIQAGNYVSPGFYYNTGEKWERLYLGSPNWFYMPSVLFDTTSTGTNLTKNLYELYKEQFGMPKYSSAGAPESIPYLPEADGLYYYVTDYDMDIFEIVSLTERGVLTYHVKQPGSAYSLINIVFVLK